MAATQQGEIRQRRRASARPVANVVPLAKREAAAWEAAAAVPMLEGPPERPGADLGHPAVRVVAHHDAGRVARQPPGRLCGNVGAVLEGGLSRGVGVGRTSVSARTGASTWTTTWYRSPGGPGSIP